MESCEIINSNFCSHYDLFSEIPSPKALKLYQLQSLTKFCPPTECTIFKNWIYCGSLGRRVCFKSSRVESFFGNLQKLNSRINNFKLFSRFIALLLKFFKQPPFLRFLQTEEQVWVLWFCKSRKKKLFNHFEKCVTSAPASFLRWNFYTFSQVLLMVFLLIWIHPRLEFIFAV